MFSGAVWCTYVPADERAVRTRSAGGAAFEGDVGYWPGFATLESRKTGTAYMRCFPLYEPLQRQRLTTRSWKPLKNYIDYFRRSSWKDNLLCAVGWCAKDPA